MDDTSRVSDPDRHFDTEHLEADLRGRSVRGGAVTMVAQVCKFVLGLGSTMVLARLLTPNDFGLIAMVTAVTGFVILFKDLGLSMATVQRAEISHDQISTLFWVNVLASFVVMLVTVALAPAIAWFYGEPRLVAITVVLAIAFIFGGLAVQHQALLRRQMRFATLAAISVASLVAGIAVGIVSAWCGAGYWALVIMQLATVIVTAGGVWITCSWRPGRPVRRSGVRSILAFGGSLTGFNVLNYVARNMDKILLGRVWGAGVLGLYERAYKLLLLPIHQINTPISSVAIPTLSRLQNDPPRYRRYYCNAMNLLAFTTTPLIVVMVALSDELILIVLGEQWVKAGIIFKVLAIAALGHPLANANGWVLISLGQTNRMLRWTFIAVPLYIFAFVIGLRWGAVGVAASYAICAHLIRFPHFFYALRYSPVAVSDLVRATWRPVTVSLIMYVAMATARFYLAMQSPVWTLLICCAAGVAALSISILVWPAARTEARDLLRLVKELRTFEGRVVRVPD